MSKGTICQSPAHDQLLLELDDNSSFSDENLNTNNNLSSRKDSCMTTSEDNHNNINSNKENIITMNTDITNESTITNAESAVKTDSSNTQKGGKMTIDFMQLIEGLDSEQTQILESIYEDKKDDFVSTLAKYKGNTKALISKCLFLVIEKQSKEELWKLSHKPFFENLE